MKCGLLLILLIMSNIGLFHSIKAQTLSGGMQHNLDSIYVEYKNEVINWCDEYGLVGDLNFILLPVFSASDEYIVSARNSYSKSCDLDFENLTNLSRADLMDYVDWKTSVLTEVLIYINNKYEGFLWQSDINKQWRTFYSRETFKHHIIIANALEKFAPDFAFRLHNINHIIFILKENQLYCYHELTNKFILFKDASNFIDIKDFAAFFNIPINVI